MERRTFLLAASAALLSRPVRADHPPVPIGLVVPLSGADAVRGRFVRDAALAAVEELNRRAGPHGRAILPTVVDTASDHRRFRDAIRRLVLDQRVVSLFGLCPDGERPGLLHFLERGIALFWDPAPYAGGECSKHVIHGGATPHQSLKHLMPWTAEQLGGRFVLVGGEGSYSRELLRVCRGVLKTIGGEAVMARDAADALSRARAGGVAAVFSSLEGAAGVALLRQYREAGFDPGRLPIVSPTLTEAEVMAAGAKTAAGHVAVQPWFSTWTSPPGWRFLDRLRRAHGGRVATSALGEAAWVQMHLFAEALGHLADGDVHPYNIREAAKERSMAAPQGIVSIERDSLHARLWPKIAVVDAAGRFRVVAHASKPVRPLPFWAVPGRVCTDSGPLWASGRRNVPPVRSE